VLAAFPLSAGVSGAQQNGTKDVVNWPPMNPLANPTADSNRYLEDSMRRQSSQKAVEKLNEQRQKDMTSETVKLLALANQLKLETDRKSSSNFSMNAVREAEQIEKLARSVREKMKETVGN
jgi:hypothetical protein